MIFGYNPFTHHPHSRWFIVSPALRAQQTKVKIRTVTLTDTAIQIIKAQKKRQAEYKLLTGNAFYNVHNFVFTEDSGDPSDKKAVYSNLKRIINGTEFEKLRVHDLRHTYSILSIQADIDIKTVQESLGHHSAVFTLDQYAFVTDGMRKSGAEKFENCQFICQMNRTNFWA
ncbi:MAG: hypothetical protein PWP56_483 [Acetobacterium sp.]|nr:hypothetical protein [Acetobacterium sp.]